MKKEFRSSGKGMRPIMGYNPKKWYANYSEIDWGHASKKSNEKLWDADPNCKHNIESAIGGGIRCTKCTGWFCY